MGSTTTTTSLHKAKATNAGNVRSPARQPNCAQWLVARQSPARPVLTSELETNNTAEFTHSYDRGLCQKPKSLLYYDCIYSLFIK